MQLKEKIFKIVLIGIASIFILTSVGLIILINSVNPNKYKPLIIASVNDNTGRKLRLDGDISWEIWPNIGLKIKQVSLSNPEGFESKSFIEMQKVSISLNIIPLFRNRIVVNDLNIQGLKLNLVKKNQENNWTFIPVGNASKNKESSSVHFELHSFSLVNSDITYHDLEQNTYKEIKNLNFNLDTSLDGGIRYSSLTQELNLEGVNFSLNKNLKGIVQLDLHNKDKLLYDGSIKLDQFSLNKLLAHLNIKPINIRNKAVLDNVSFSSDFEGNNKSVNLSNLTLNIGQSIIKGKVSVNHFAPMALQNDLSIDQFEGSDLVSLNGYQIPMSDISLRGNINNADMGESKMSIHQHLTIKNVMLYGINIQHHINYARKILTVNQFTNPISLFQRLETLLSSSTKLNLRQKTDLGKLDTDIEFRNGILTTPRFRLNGPTLRITNRGFINLNKNYINYYTYSKIVSVPANSLLGSITYLYVIHGNLNNPQTGVDKTFLQNQIIDYYDGLGQVNRIVKSVKQGTEHLWNKLFN